MLLTLCWQGMSRAYLEGPDVGFKELLEMQADIVPDT